MQRRRGHGNMKNNDALSGTSETIGAYLRAERISRDIALEEVADATGISTRVLYALEKEDKEHLPPEIYIKAFYKKYADYLGLESEETYSKYQQQPRSLKKPGSRLNFSTVITLKGQEENFLAGFLRRLFLPVVILVSGFLLYWVYKNYLATYYPFSFYREHFSGNYALLPSEVYDFFC